MRAHTTTITALVVCALAIPAAASAQPVDQGYSTPNAIQGGLDDSSQPVSGSDYSSVNSVAPPSSESSSVSGSPDESSGTSSLNAITGPPSGEPTLVSGSPASTDDGFDWLSAGIGAATAMALVALGGAALLAVRRRTAVSPSAASMS
jgi:hypothetical protein